MKMLLAAAMLLIATPCVHAADWKPTTGYVNDDMLYDASSLQADKDSHIRMWVKRRDTSEMTFIEIRCKDRALRILQIDNRPTRNDAWGYAQPDSLGAERMRSACLLHCMATVEECGGSN